MLQFDNAIWDEMHAKQYFKQVGPTLHSGTHYLLYYSERLKVGEDLLDIIQDHPGSGILYFRGLIAVKSLLDQKRQRRKERVMPEVIVYLGKSGSGKSHHCWNDPDYQHPDISTLSNRTGRYTSTVMGGSCYLV